MSIAPRDRLDAHRLVEDYHDRRQRRRGARARGEEGAGHVPRPRAAEPREAGRAQGLSRRPSASSSRSARWSSPAPSTASSSASATATAARRSWSSCCARRCRRATGPSGSAISGWRSRPMPISPRRSAAMPTCSSTARLVKAYRAGRGRPCRRATKSASSRSASRSRCSSGARWRPSATPSTAMSPLILPTSVGQLVECRITGVQPFGFFATVEDLGGDGLVLAQGPRPGIFPLRRGRQAAGRRRNRRNLSHRAAADPAACRGQPGQRLAALRIARGKLWRARGSDAPRSYPKRAASADGRPTSATSRGAASGPSRPLFSGRKLLILRH